MTNVAPSPDRSGQPRTSASPSPRIIEDAVCTCCGCVCDDIELHVDGSKIVQAKRACDLGAAWFLNQPLDDRAACSIAGQPATVEEGLERAAEILVQARYPLVYGLSDTTVESQRVATAIGDWIGANVDTTTSVGHGPSVLAFQRVGQVTASLGEIRNRGDFIMFWGTDPAESHPRHMTRYSLMPTGRFVPNGRKDRTCVVIDVRKTESARTADIFLQIGPGGDFEALWALRALAQGLALDPQQVEQDTGQPLSVWQDLMDRMKAARYGAIFFGTGLTATRGTHANAEALLALTRDLNKYTRFVACAHRGSGNVTGADQVVTWRTGYPFGINLSRGYPRFHPGEYTASEVLVRGEADAALIVAADPLTRLSQPARQHLLRIPTIALDFRETPTMRQATVAFPVATYGINVPGTVYRMDDVPIVLRPALESSRPSDTAILQELERRIRQRQAASAASDGHRPSRRP